MKRLLTTSIACFLMIGIANGQQGVSTRQYQVPVSEVHEPMQKGRYQPTWASLETHQTPEWFRDAKFGI